MEIRIWENARYYFIDLTSNGDSYEIKRFPERDYGEKLQENIAYHVNRLMSVTGITAYKNETKLDI